MAHVAYMVGLAVHRPWRHGGATSVRDAFTQHACGGLSVPGKSDVRCRLPL